MESAIVESMINKFNSYYLSAPNRTNLYYLTQIYREIKTKLWPMIAPARQNALTTKIIAFQSRVRAAEWGLPVAPISVPTGAVIPIEAPPISLPSDSGVATQKPIPIPLAPGAAPADVLKNIGDQITAFYYQNKSMIQMAGIAMLALKVLPMILQPAPPARRKR